ncbi:ATP-dependent DNA helicase RecG [Kocuria sp. JC486]|uniref:ATP-dependent DNA helicase RecG n=1 Tax=Kocuria sp. JC486 TaxID=1970736 RepID=UPI0014236F47|nr:ATP-dependent DNA helicase RecG [Kocuria sp. JC486]NHU84609.1 ATP-dependent DNA helicase RecG [Kocuria sp. JC486]
MAKGLDLNTVGELLDHVPRRLVQRGELTSFADLELEAHATLVAEVVSVNTRRMRNRRGSITEVVITDRSDHPGSDLLGRRENRMTLSFFNAWTAARELTAGTHALFSGKVTHYRGSLTMTNPHYAPLDVDDDVDTREAMQNATRPIAVYPATAKVTSDRIATAVHTVLGVIDWRTVPDPLPAEIADRHGYTDLPTAYEHLHRPPDESAWYRAKARFRHTEALVLQTALVRRRRAVELRPAPALPGKPDGVAARFEAALPFRLTDSQVAVGEELAADLAREHPMNRLLQGDVGAGKTVVALRAMLQAVDSGAQAALLAPTEVLAAQHFASIESALGPLAHAGTLGGDPDGTTVVLLTGSMPQSARKRALLQIASGEAGIVIGTHALLSDTVQFADLGLVVVDEQHRFGVEQRDRLREAGLTVPHLLVMTATPIPRTVAMTVFGDLDVSVLQGLPGGRQPISTHVVGLLEHPTWEDRIFARAREEVEAGRQVYFVAPKIGDDDAVPPMGLADSARALAEIPEATDPVTGAQDSAEQAPGPEEAMVSTAWLAELVEQSPQLGGIPSAVLHGRLDPTDKAEVMAAFADGRTGVLVCTTVVEVGVDVPNATFMVVFDADRFGISQLHQLRGRIGRGSHASTCLLVTRREQGHPSRERLDAVAATTDGFELAQADLNLRREGDILGDAQSGGRSTLRLLRALDDVAVIEEARTEATEILEADPDLENHPGLAAAIAASLDEDTEKYLERG